MPLLTWPHGGRTAVREGLWCVYIECTAAAATHRRRGRPFGRTAARRRADSVIRIRATDGRAGRLPPEVLRDMCTLSVREACARRWRTVNTDLLSTPEAVACSHSHWRCWRQAVVRGEKTI